MKQELNQIIETCNSQLKILDNYAKQICSELPQKCENLDWKAIGAEYKEPEDLPGIYVILVRLKGTTTLEMLQAALEIKAEDQKSPSPLKDLSVVIEIQDELKLPQNIHILYLGKSEHLNSRIKEHLIHPTNKGTYALALGKRKIPSDIEIAFLTEPLSQTPIPLYSKSKPETAGLQFVMTNLESILRKTLKPLVGKQ